MRTHITVPDALVAEVDKLVGQRRRSRFFVEVVSKEVARLNLLRAIEGASGVIREGDVPEWDTFESAAEWVDRLRQVDAEHLDALHAADQTT